MSRMFDTHLIRETKSLDGLWDFKMEGFDKAYKMPVPGCWEQHPDFVSYRGIGVYKKKVYIKKNGNVRLEFKGVSHTADVYFDGEMVAHHYNAFTPFSCVIKDVSQGEHEISVRADNTFSEASALHVPNDYYTYGGITRPAVLEYISDVYIKYMHFTPSLKDGKWCGKTEICLVNLSGRSRSVMLKNELAGTAESREVELGANEEKIISFEKKYENVIPWDTQNPQLYYIKTSISGEDIADDLIDRVGFRIVAITDKQFLLNGEPVFIQGVNRHEDYAIVGCAIPVQLMANDIDLIEELGANSVRTSHYPNDERFLDMCDERGLLVWEENHARGFDLKKMQNPNFERQCKDCIDEMIENHYNHPAIVIWGVLNECASETLEGREMYKKQLAQIKSLDLSRPTTFATCRHFKDICLDLPDIVSYNYYTGWYSGDDAEKDLKDELDWIRSSGGDGKPVILSEFGAGGIYGYRDRTRAKWSEERQMDVILANLKTHYKNENLAGIYIWQFSDCRVTEEEWFYGRPKSQNNKGLVDIYRRPKLAFDAVKEIYNK